MSVTLIIFAVIFGIIGIIGSIVPDYGPPLAGQACCWHISDDASAIATIKLP